MALMSAYNDELDPESKSTYEQVAYVCMQEDVYVSSKPSNTFRKQVLPSFSSFRLGARVTAFLVRPAVSSSYLSNVATRYRSRQGPERLHIAATAETQVTESHLEPAYYFNQDNLDAFEEESISHRTASAALDRLESIGMSSPSHVVSLCRILEHSKHRSCWEYSVEALVSDTLELAIKADVSRNTILLVYSTKSGLASRRANIFEFQDYVRDHIKTYADRVEKHQLGSSELVCRDIEDTMLEVWQSMPVGFGASQPLESHPGGQYPRWRL
ncbi:hypothetical protein FRC07_002550 [Ceratobasidium sp. 392]|nr:hypothetical protein FRC07_002550 [Ceratobasidium sp. 392]